MLKRPYELGDNVQRARRTRYVPVVLSQKELEQVFSHMDEPYLLIAQLLYGCGLRLSEGLRLRVAQLNLSHKILTVHRGKGRKDRTVPLPDQLVPNADYIRNPKALWVADVICLSHKPSRWKP